MSPEDQDRELSRLYQRSATSESPPELDQRILEAARVLAPQEQPWYRQHWMPALSATLVVGLALTLAIPVGEDPGVSPGAPLNSPEVMHDELMEYRISAEYEDEDRERDQAGSVAEEKSSLRAARKMAPADVSEAAARGAAAERAQSLPAATMNANERLMKREEDGKDRDPAVWLETIEALLDQDAPAARQEFLEFKQRYPGFEVEEALRKRLEAAAERD